MSAFTRFLGGGCAVTVVGLTCSALPALAAWSTEPVTITPTAASIPVVEGCADGAHGVFVAWQEGSPTGILRVQHLLPTGDLDPAWPAAGAIASDVAAARSELAAVPDRLGGVYLSWKEGVGLYVSRLEPSGAVAAGWPAHGRFLSGVFADSPRPTLIEDGAHGIYVGWGSTTSTAFAIHLGPANTGAGGWPNAARSVGVADLAYNTVYWPQLALASDGGLFVAWAASSTDEEAAPSAWRLRRLTTAGLTAAGWPVGGLSFGSFQRELLGSPIQASLLALSPDGRGGVFLSIGNPIGVDPGSGAILETRLYRLQGSGESASGWPAEGRVATLAPPYYTEFGSTPDYSYRVFDDAGDGALAGFPQYGLHDGSSVSFVGCDETGQFDPWWAASARPLGYEVAGNGSGGRFVASFYPTGPTGPYQPYAFLSVHNTNPGWNGWFEYSTECCVTRYGDIGLAATEDGGAVFFWSQVRERIGLFARRFNPAGEVTAVEPASSPAFALSRLRFAPGVGVRAAVTLPNRARFELFDLAGRRLASQAIEAGAHEMTIAGTSALPSGLYFGRLTAGAQVAGAKLIVAR